MPAHARNNRIKRNIFVKIAISILLGFGIFCVIFAIQSCRWFVFLQDDEARGNRFVQHWSFLSEEELESTISVGIFRYHVLTVEELYDDDKNSNATSSTVVATVGNEAYRTTSNEGCVAYSDLWVGVEYPWKFTSQIFSVLGPVLAFSSWCVMIVGAEHHWIFIFLLSSTGVQAATVISSLSWCDEHLNCPWLLGALVNLAATCLFLTCWALAVWGLVEVKNTRPRITNRNGTGQSQNREKRRQNPDPDNNTNNESTDADESYPPSIVVAGDKTTGKRNEENASRKSASKKTEDVESGQNTIPLHTADQLSEESGVYVFENFSTDEDDKWSMSSKEVYYDTSFDDEDTKSESKPTSQNNPMFRDPGAKSKNCPENKKHDSSLSETSDDNESNSDDSSSTNSNE